MTPRRKRMIVVGLILLGVSVAAGLGLTAFQKNLLYFYTPTQVAAGEAP
ncbi:MAG: cytochrome c maturation protein CcmE, partial [Methylomagnum sp.]